MTSKKRAFLGIWIPAEVWLNKELSIIEKVFLVEISSLDNSDGCYASNRYFAEFFGISNGRASQIIKSLEEKNLIKCSYTFTEKNVKKRSIKVFNKLKGGIKNSKEGYLENDEYSNTLSNNTIDYSYIQNLFNSTCLTLPKCQVLNDSRKKAIKKRCQDFNYPENQDVWLTFFQRVNNSDFLSGRKTDFKASFDWIIKSANFIKIMEGNYDNDERKPANNQTRTETAYERRQRELKEWEAANT